MIKINQVAALRAKVFLHLADDPGRSVPDRVDVGGRAEAGPDRACKKLSSGGFDAALDRAVVDRRLAPLGVREANLGLSPRQRLALTLVLLAGLCRRQPKPRANDLSHCSNLRLRMDALGQFLPP